MFKIKFNDETWRRKTVTHKEYKYIEKIVNTLQNIYLSKNILHEPLKLFIIYL